MSEDNQHRDVLSTGPGGAPAPANWETHDLAPGEVHDLGELDADPDGEFDGLDGELGEEPAGPGPLRRLLAGFTSPEALSVTGLLLLLTPLFATNIVVKTAAWLAGLPMTISPGENTSLAAAHRVTSAYGSLCGVLSALAVAAAITALLRNRDGVRWITGIAGAGAIVGLLMAAAYFLAGTIGNSPYGVYI